jgi:hypothetical protein
MKLPKLTAFALASCFAVLSSCTNNSQEIYEDNYYTATVTMNGAQETPAVVTNAGGVLTANYNKLSKVLNYTISFSGLSGNATMAHIHGTAEAGFAAGVLQTFSGFPLKTSGTYTGTLFFDGIKIKEEDLLAGKYYANIHTAANTNGEIRGQLIMNKY